MARDHHSVARPAPLARPAKKIWDDESAIPGPLAFGRVEWDQFDAEAEGESSAICQARYDRIKRPPSRHGY